MNVSLTPEQEQFVADRVASGTYDAPDEIVREGLRLVMEQDALRQIRLDALRRDIDQGLEQIAHGEYGPLNVNQLLEEGKQKLRERHMKQPL